MMRTFENIDFWRTEAQRTDHAERADAAFTASGGGTEAALEVAAVDCRDPAAGPSGRRSGECGESDVRVTAAGSESFVRDIVCERVREAR